LTGPLTTRAPAKVNLTLHIVGRRTDGYHELESLVAFAGIGDTLSLVPGEPLLLSVSGSGAPQAGGDRDNLVLRAARALRERLPGLRAGAFQLVKRLPVAAGLGGGSSDAAAALRLLARLNGLRPGDPALVEAARAAGADVPVCLERRTRMMRGAGEVLGPPLKLPPLSAVLLNPRVPIATPAIFQALGLEPGEGAEAPPHPEIRAATGHAELFSILREARNDLEPAAVKLAPVIREALALLRGIEGCRLARMSGSGATVFGLFDKRDASALAAKMLGRARPGWWVKATELG
jgi:4-diphosphocytidyl-2-C-methyl-D-erythritol kinase